MSSYVNQHGEVISQEIRNTISERYHTITKALNKEFWDSASDTIHSLYVGSYGRGTAIDASDVDMLMELPEDEYNRYDWMKGNGQSRLLQAVKNAILKSYPRSDISADGQVVVINFSDGMKFEVLPAFDTWFGFKYPDTNMGGNWKPTNPKTEQDAMKEKNNDEHSNGLLFDTCKHIRRIHNEKYSSYKLSGIVIDSFVYYAIGQWRWASSGMGNAKFGSYERHLLDCLENGTSHVGSIFYAPGSRQEIDGSSSIECLEKVLQFMVG